MGSRCGSIDADTGKREASFHRGSWSRKPKFMLLTCCAIEKAISYMEGEILGKTPMDSCGDRTSLQYVLEYI